MTKFMESIEYTEGWAHTEKISIGSRLAPGRVADPGGVDPDPTPDRKKNIPNWDLTK